MASLTPGFVEALLLTVLVSGASACVRTSLQDTPNGRADARSVGALAFRAEDDQLLLLNEPGTLYLLDFVAVGCKPCVEEAPDMERLDREFGASGRFRLVTVVFGWPSNQLADRREELNLEHLTLYADEGGSAARALEVQGWPTKCLIRDGRVLLHRVGGGPGAYSIWRKIIREHLKRRSTAELQASPPNNGVNATARRSSREDLAAWLSVIASLAMAMVFCTSCDGYVGARGRVVTADGSPLVGAQVVLDGPDYPQRFRAVSGADGCFQLGRTTAPTGSKFPMTVSKDGFQSVTTTVQGADTSSEFTVRLVTTNADSPSEAIKGPSGAAPCNWHGISQGTDVFWDSRATE